MKLKIKLFLFTFLCGTTATFADNVLPGAFVVRNVNAFGDSVIVHFSPGNLQYHTTEHVWRFAEHQYDFVGGTEFGERQDYEYGNVYVTSEGDSVKCNNHEWLQEGSEYSGWIDLFGWGTGNDPLKSTLDAIFELDGDDKWTGNIQWQDSCSYTYHEWGNNIPSSDGEWVTLPSALFSSLIKNCFVQGRQLDISISFDNGELVGGTLLLPDGWDNSITNAYRDRNLIRVTESQWADLEQRGAVILPSAGVVAYTNDYYDGLKWRYSRTVECGDDGYGAVYWTSSFPWSESDHYASCVRTDFVPDENGKRYAGEVYSSSSYRKFPVRLVQITQCTTGFSYVEQQRQKAHKLLKNGHLYIVDNIGKAYNVCGSVIAIE